MRRSFCLIPLATNMLESWDIIHWKGGIHSFVWSTNTFLFDIQELRDKQIKRGYQISKCLNIGQSYCLEIWYCCDLYIVSLAMIILEGCDISHFKDDILIKHAEIKVKQYGTTDFKTLRLSNIQTFWNLIPCFILLISRLLNIVQKSFCTPDEAMDLTFPMNYVPAF